MTQMKLNSPDVIQPWNSFIAPTERIEIGKAEGRKAASTIRQYPPGIPEIIPGMTYTDDVLNILKTSHSAGSDIIGIDMASDPSVEVVIEAVDQKPTHDIQTIFSCDVDQLTSNEIAVFFRIGFQKAPYFHFAFHESDPLQSLPHNLDFDAYTVSVGLSDNEKRTACQNTLRAHAIEKLVRSDNPPDSRSVILPQGFHLWTDKQICREKIAARLADPGYVTLVRSSKTGHLEGLLHSRMATIERLFKSEEWSDPLVFSSYSDPELKSDPNEFFENIHYHFGLTASDPAMTISAQILNPEIQGGDIFYDMMRSMARYVSPEHTRLPLLCEIPPFGTAHTLNTAFTDRIVFGVLKNNHPLVFCAQTSQALFPFISDKKHWHSTLRKAVLDKNSFRTKYYIPLPTDHPHVTVKPNGKLGLAVFATQDIPAGSTIAVFTGETYRSETALGLPEIMRDHAIQIGANEFVFGYKGLAHCVCHSCDPNCGIQNKTTIFTVRDIIAGEQITWDYRCSENSNWVLETCLCNSPRCTGSVGNYDSLPPFMKSQYLSQNMVSEWLSDSKRSILQED